MLTIPVSSSGATVKTKNPIITGPIKVVPFISANSSSATGSVQTVSKTVASVVTQIAQTKVTPSVITTTTTTTAGGVTIVPTTIPSTISSPSLPETTTTASHKMEVEVNTVSTGSQGTFIIMHTFYDALY